MRRPAGCSSQVVISLAMLVLAGSSCSDEQPPDGQASGALERARARFVLLETSLARALPLEQRQGRWSSIRDQAGRSGLHQLEVTLAPRAGGAMRLASGPVLLEVRPAGATGAAAVRVGRALVYPGGYRQADALHVVELDRAEELVYLRDERAPRRYVYDLRLVRGGRVERRGGFVQVLDREGNARLRLERPFVLDAAGRRLEVEVTLAGTRLTLDLPHELRSFPALLDPGWATTGKMATARYDHTATLLKTGKVLVAGGCCPSLATAELYDPKSGTWTSTGSMWNTRDEHTATLLASGKVLAAGGASSQQAEIYDPATGKWSKAASMIQARRRHTATRLLSGEVLVAGGALGSTHLASAELFKETTGKWSNTAAMGRTRSYHAAALLPSGKVLVVHGHNASNLGIRAELYDPKTAKWAVTGGSSSHAALGHLAATLLNTKQVLVTGGMNFKYGRRQPLLYDPATDSWSSAESMKDDSRMSHTVTTLLSGTALLAGGYYEQPAFPSHFQYHSSVELYDPKLKAWSAMPPMTVVRYRHTATLLPLGQVLLAGGRTKTTTHATAELYDPTSGDACTTASSCASGYCADGVCCESACTQPCKVCVKQSGSFGTLGRCVDVAAGKTDLVASTPCKGTGLCNGKGACKAGIGQPCAVAADCGNGLCVDGICCSSACKTTCYACNVSGKLGSCSPLPASTPDSQALVTCSGTKACDGKGNCKAGAGLACAADAACASGFCTDQVCCKTRCDGKCLSCKVAGAAGTCTPYKKSNDPDLDCAAGLACDGAGACKSKQGQACTTAGQCISGHCVDGRCCAEACTATCKSCAAPGFPGLCKPLPAGLPDSSAVKACSGSQACDGKGECRAASGQQCAKAADCATGHCVDKVCCASACSASCHACNVSGKAGTCAPIPAGQQDLAATSPCSGSKACDGMGSCKPGNGSACSADKACASGFCADFVCCDQACGATCFDCNVSGKAGTCAPVPAGSQDLSALSACGGTGACDGKGACKLGAGRACKQASDCASGYCVDQVCCTSACSGTCVSCALKGKEGTCSTITAKTDPDGECKGTYAKCSGYCDGKGKCAYPGDKNLCSLCLACDGKGGCTSSAADDPACGSIDCDTLDTACLDYQDLTSGRCSAPGKCKEPNVKASCTRYTNKPCGDGGQDAGTGKDQGSTDDDPSSEGCSCRAAGPGDPAGVGLTLLLLGLVLIRSRFT